MSRPRKYATNADRQRAYRKRAKGARRRSVEWYTPTDVFEWFSARWGPFDVDPCAANKSPTSALIPGGIYSDGLALSWDSTEFLGDRRRDWRAFVNPPYGRAELPLWADRAFAAVRDGEVELAALLVPLRPSSAWFRRSLERGAELVPLPRRVRFLELLPDGTLQRTSGALFECCALVFRNGSTVTEPQSSTASDPPSLTHRRVLIPPGSPGVAKDSD